MAGDICSASQSDMEHWLTVARNAYPDAGRFADFLSSEAAVIDETCPRRRPTFDDATAAATNVRIGANGEAP